MKQQRILFPDEADAIAFWSDKEIKIWAVDIAAGPERRPTYRHTYYARARTADRAIECVKRDLLRRVPGALYRARLAGPRELGCHRVTAETTPAELHAMAAEFYRIRDGRAPNGARAIPVSRPWPRDGALAARRAGAVSTFRIPPVP
ncbi:hypothetical protein [Burkholderia ubonensis]|uniref:hypothetical protein n=1 Tax=Burkholderia ubonensis TaxID=101571 RepID=UPI000B12E068|nr:hypothetical protein [Burkholderia ubonensis]